MSGLFGETVVLHARTAGTPDADGNDTWTTADTTVNNVTLYPTDSTELVQGQDLNVIRLTAVFIPAVTIAPTDTVTARGHVWEVDAATGDYHSPLTGHTITKAFLKRATG